MRERRIVRPGGVVAVILLLAAGGCTHVVGFNADYYEKSPRQVAPPDGVFPAGTRVLRLGADGSYAHVISAGGVKAYVLEATLVPILEWDPDRAATDEIEEDEPAKGSPFGPPQR